MKDILLKVSDKTSIVHCGENAFESLAPALADRQLFIVTDSNVFAYYRYDIWRIFGNEKPIHILPAGETSKTMRNLTAILKAMLDSGMRRGCTVVALGGGVVGDIAGLAASLYMRGVNLVQIPTTLLAQVDSSVGGKTAIDFGGVKNVIGAFYQPEEVIADPIFLKTLTDREIRCGLGEIVKYGALNEDIYNLINRNIGNLRSDEFLAEVTYLCIKHKAAVVESDERDLGGLRKTLNLGHTTGHALELYYRKKSHGEYVLIGMYYELYIAEKLGFCPIGYADSLRTAICAVIKRVPYYDDIEKAAELAKFDKKNKDENISMIVPAAIGKTADVSLPIKDYARMIADCSAELKSGR